MQKHPTSTDHMMAVERALAYDASIDVCGDILGVHWIGSVWQCPTTGSQHAREWDALAVELRHYMAASGEDVSEIDGQYVRDHYEIVRL